MSNTASKNSLGSFYTNLGKTANSMANSVAKTANSVANSVTETTNDFVNNFGNSASKTLNSLVPLTAKKNNNSLFGLFQNQKNNTAATPKTNNNSLLGLFQNQKNNTATPIISNTAKPVNQWAWPLILFLIITTLAITILVKFKSQISAGIHNIGQKIRDALNKPSSPPVDASKPPTTNVTEAPVSPQQQKLTEQTIKKTSDIIDKIIPLGNPEVYNVSKNDFTYYDAEPLCRALGAELATYDQVKEAWSKGADWCNYGWVKGQAAVYPIQEETYNKVQAGPEEDRNSCGTVGINGGFFDNPELKFGVNCYGVKPTQSEHDEELLMKQGNLPKTVASLAVDKKVQEFKKEADNLGVLPFNTEKWSD